MTGADRARVRLEAFWRAWAKDRDKLDPMVRSVVNDLALVLADLIGPTMEDGPRHCCGAQGFGEPGDVCPACEAALLLRTRQG